MATRSVGRIASHCIIPPAPPHPPRRQVRTIPIGVQLREVQSNTSCGEPSIVACIAANPSSNHSSSWYDIIPQLPRGRNAANDGGDELRKITVEQLHSFAPSHRRAVAWHVDQNESTALLQSDDQYRASTCRNLRPLGCLTDLVHCTSFYRANHFPSPTMPSLFSFLPSPAAFRGQHVWEPKNSSSVS